MKLRDILKWLRPARLGRLVLNYRRLILSLDLLKAHFPAALAEDMTGVAWPKVLHRLVTLADEADWFEGNWPILDEAYEYWQQGLESGQGDHLAVYLKYIPVTLYGFDEKIISRFPPMELLHTLLAECQIETVPAQLLADAGIHDGLDRIRSNRERAWALLHRIEAGSGRYPEPVRWLPELACWACHRSGNFMLDHRFDPYDKGPWFTWAADLEEVRQAWRRARPVIKAFDRLMKWHRAGEANIAALAHFILEGGSCDRLDW